MIMKKNLFLRLCLMMAVVLSLYSCIHDEIYSSSDPSSTEYTNKSLWKQDEKYIKNVMKVYAENEADIKKVNGIPYWNYATTVDSFDESFVAIPVVDNGKVISVLKVPRHGNKIYFYYTHDESDLLFFQGLVFAKHKKAGMTDGSTAQTDGMACTRQWMSMWFPDSESNPDPDSGSGHWESVSIIKCKTIKDECVGVINEFGQCEGSGDDGGYTYPGGGGGGGTEPEEEEDPCDKIKAKFADQRVKNQFNALNTQANFDKDHEEAFYEKAADANGSIIQSFTPVSGPPCADYVKLPSVKTGITGFGHTHNNYDCKGRQSILVPSADDIMVFLYTMVKQAGNVYGDYSQAYYLTVTSGGSYMFQYTGSTSPSGLSFDIVALRKEYEKLFYSLKEEHSNIPQDKAEKAFMKFLKESVNIDGLELYKVTPNSSEKMEYDANTQSLIKTPCPTI
jgi:hypothetical protein